MYIIRYITIHTQCPRGSPTVVNGIQVGPCSDITCLDNLAPLINIIKALRAKLSLQLPVWLYSVFLFLLIMEVSHLQNAVAALPISLVVMLRDNGVPN